MATFKVIFEKKQTWTGYIEATNSQDAVNKVRYPQVEMDDGNTSTGWPGDQTNWEVQSNETTYDIKSLGEIGTTTVVDIPAAVEPE